MEVMSLLATGSKVIVFLIILPAAALLSFIGIPIGVPFLILATLHYWQYGPVEFTGTMLLLLTILTFMEVFLDNIVLIFGLKRTNATKRGYIGALLGSLAGIFSGQLWGILFFSAGGAIAGEMIGGRTFKESFKSGLGAALGLLFGSLLRAALTLTIVSFVLSKLLF